MNEFKFIKKELTDLNVKADFFFPLGIPLGDAERQEKSIQNSSCGVSVTMTFVFNHGWSQN